MRDLQSVSQGTNDIMVVYLTKAPSSETLVQHLEFVHQDYRNRYLFRNEKRLAEVFHEDLAKKLSNALDRFNPSTRALSLPEFEFRRDDLVIRGLWLFLNPDPSGVNKYMIRFRELSGALAGAFSINLSIGGGADTAQSQISLDILADIALPLFDIANSVAATSAETGESNPDLEERLRRLGERSHELMMQLSLLKRHATATALSDAGKGAQDLDELEFERTVKSIGLSDFDFTALEPFGRA